MEGFLLKCVVFLTVISVCVATDDVVLNRLRTLTTEINSLKTGMASLSTSVTDQIRLETASQIKQQMREEMDRILEGETLESVFQTNILVQMRRLERGQHHQKRRLHSLVETLSNMQRNKERQRDTLEKERQTQRDTLETLSNLQRKMEGQREDLEKERQTQRDTVEKVHRNMTAMCSKCEMNSKLLRRVLKQCARRQGNSKSANRNVNSEGRKLKSILQGLNSTCVSDTAVTSSTPSVSTTTSTVATTTPIASDASTTFTTIVSSPHETRPLPPTPNRPFQKFPRGGKPQLHLIAMNNPMAGNLRGIRGADYECNRQARESGYRGTYRAFMSSQTQNLDSMIYYRRYRNLPVVNARGETLFPTWSDLFNGEGGYMDGDTKIYSFNGRDIMNDSTWPQKLVWHGSNRQGKLHSARYCRKWLSNNYKAMGVASSLMKHMLLDEEEYACNNSFIVLCIETTSRRNLHK